MGSLLLYKSERFTDILALQSTVSCALKTFAYVLLDVNDNKVVLR